MRVPRLLPALVAVGLAACEQPGDPVAPPIDPRTVRSSPQLDENVAAVGGSGQYDIAGLLVTFAIDAVEKANGSAEGDFRIFADEGGGLTVDVVGKVICLAVDPVNRRAWIGGRVKANESTDPDLRTKIHRPGHDVWFRVLDDPAGDRSTFLGFEGAAGFITSADYCAGQPWPAENARTWPVVAGGLSIQP